MAYAPLKNYVPMWQYNTRHNGVYGDYLQVGINTIETKIPEKFSLYQNYPNPFNPVTKISFDIAKQEFVSLKIFDALGRELNTLVNEVKAPGSYAIDFDGTNLPSGIYFYKLQTENYSGTKKMLLIK
jgi:hypothetical protein